MDTNEGLSELKGGRHVSPSGGTALAEACQTVKTGARRKKICARHVCSCGVCICMHTHMCSHICSHTFAHMLAHIQGETRGQLQFLNRFYLVL